MPYQIEKRGDYFEVTDDNGKPVGKHPTRKQATEQLRALYANVPEAKEQTPDPAPIVTAESKEIERRNLFLQQHFGRQSENTAESKPGIVERVLSFLKEGRRNATPDAVRLQQIHDLAVANGADCMFSVKEVGGVYRWVLLSSNAYQDSDKEIVAQKALEADVERTDKEAGGNYGPLRWWHMGNPDPLKRIPGDGVDIGVCDFRAMQGKMLIESGTFKDNRVGAAVAKRADSLAASIGFFHPLNQPDSEGVYNTIHVFERSVLPRSKASNQLTALTVTNQKEQKDMATMQEKWKEFVTMLGGDEDMAKSVVKQASEAEATADEKGLKFKEEAAPVTPEQAAPATTEKAAEPEAKPEADEKPDEMAAFMEKFMPVIEQKMSDMIAASRKEYTEKEAGMEAQITALTTQVKEQQAVIVTLAGDMPRGVRAGFRASTAESTLTTKEAPNAPKPDPLGDFQSWITTSLAQRPA